MTQAAGPGHCWMRYNRECDRDKTEDRQTDRQSHTVDARQRLQEKKKEKERGPICRLCVSALREKALALKRSSPFKRLGVGGWLIITFAVNV